MSVETGDTTDQSINNTQRPFRTKCTCLPQLYALVTGGTIFITGGINLALGLDWSYDVSIRATLQFRISWFGSVMLGALLAAPLINFMPKKFFFFCSAALVTVSGALNASIPTVAIILSARYINGIAIGFATVAFLVHGGEAASVHMRGKVVSMEQFGTMIGIFLHVICEVYCRSAGFGVLRTIGVISMLMGVLALIFTFPIMESPIYHLRLGNHKDAFNSARSLYGAHEQTRTQLQAEGHYVLESEKQTISQSFAEGLSALWKMLLYRSMVALSFTLPLSGEVEIFGLLSTHSFWPMIVYAGLRLMGGFTVILLLEFIGRKFFGLFGLLGVGVLSAATGGVFYKNFSFPNMKKETIICTLLLVLQLFAGLFAPSSSTYLSEAFPLKLKPYFIAACVMLEQVIQIIVICTFTLSIHNLYIYNICVGVITLLLFLLFCFVMPETRTTSLNEAQQRFQKIIRWR